MSTAEQAAIARVNYAAYLRSAAWRQQRNRYWRSKLPRDCYCCGAGWRPAFLLHHRTLVRLGCERMSDLAPVCPDCHRLVRQLYRGDAGWQRRGLWAVTVHVKRLHRGRARRIARANSGRLK